MPTRLFRNRTCDMIKEMGSNQIGAKIMSIDKNENLKRIRRSNLILRSTNCRLQGTVQAGGDLSHLFEVNEQICAVAAQDDSL